MEKNENKSRNFSGENTDKTETGKNILKKNFASKDLIFTTISFIMLLAGGVVVYLLYNSWNQKHLNRLQAQESSFTEQLNARDSMINEWVLAFSEIEENLNIIKEKEKIITVRSSDSEFMRDRKQEIIDDINYINSLMEANKLKIDALNKQLKTSGGMIKSLQDKIAMLEESMKKRENEIDVLKVALQEKDFEIGQLNTRMSDLQVIVTQQDARITDQSSELSSHIETLNTAFLVCGTFKDLKEMGLVSREGGFLGLGRSVSLNEKFDDNLFNKININETRTIPVQSKNVKLITTHPADSYELLYDETSNQVAYIEIKNPDQFWKISKYAVLEFSK